MSKQTHRTIHIPVMHQSLQRTLTRFLNDHSEAPEHCTDDVIILEEIDFCDFGVKYKLIQLQTDNGTRADFQVLIPGWQEIQTDAIERLRAIYGGSLYCRNDAKSKGNYDFVIRLNEAVDNFDSVDSCATSLAQIRVQAAGAPLFKALDRIVSNESESSKSMEKVYRLLAQPRCGTCHCISSAEK